MTPEIELMRARELALAAQDASQLFWIMLIGGAVVIGFWSLVRWRTNRRRSQRQRRAALRMETNRHAKAQGADAHRAGAIAHNVTDEAFWRAFARRNDLPESTRITLLASTREKARP
jgi:hypothetical protein